MSPREALYDRIKEDIDIASATKEIAVQGILLALAAAMAENTEGDLYRHTMIFTKQQLSRLEREKAREKK